MNQWISHNAEADAKNGKNNCLEDRKNNSIDLLGLAMTDMIREEESDPEELKTFDIK